MTCGFGTKGIPKDYKFENILRSYLIAERFDKILYYDSCIIERSNKEYGKIIIGDSCVYSYTDNGKVFSIVSDFKDIISIDLLNDIPQFLIGPMRNSCIHIKLMFYARKKKNLKSENKEKPSIRPTLCCDTSIKEKNSELSEPLLLSNSNIKPSGDSGDDRNKMMNTTINSSDFLVSIESIDFYVLNKYSPVLGLLRKAYVDYLISQTLNLSLESGGKDYQLAQNLISNLFDGLILDISNTINAVRSHCDFLLELINSGYKYSRIKILFWSKPDLFDFLVEQFVERLELLFSIDKSNLLASSRPLMATKQVTNTCLDCVNVFLQVFNIFFCQTDHLYSKYEKIRKNGAKSSISLIRNLLELVAYLNMHDRYDSPVHCVTEIDVNIDETKYEMTINAVQLFYYLINSSQVYFNDEEMDSFTARSVRQIIESALSYDDNEAPFNLFVNHALRMIFIWLFPDKYKLHCPLKLDPQQVVTIFYFFTSLRIIMKWIPKIIEILRREMQEEFNYFILQEISFSEEYFLSQSTLKLLKTFQKNMTSSNEMFID